MEHLISQLLASLDHTHSLIYGLAFFAALLETVLLVGLILPGSTLLLFIGAYATGSNLDFIGLWCFAVVGATLGDNLNYFLGRRYGHRWVAKGWWFLKPKHIEHSRHFFDVHGTKSVFLGRFVPGMKELMPFVAGTVKMRQGTFMLWNILGAMGWGLQWLGVGYLFAQSLNIAQLWLPRVGMMLLLAILFYILLWGLQRLIINYGQAVLSFFASLWHSIHEAVIHNADVQKLVNHYPRFFGFIQQRLERSHFYGLTLTLLSLAFLYILILFGGIVEDLIMTDPIIYLDHHIAQLIMVFRTPEVLHFFIWVTELGNPQLVLPVAILICVALWVAGRGLLTLPLFTSVAGSAGFILLGKLAFQRPRPVEAVLLDHSYSFPSGHATFAMSFYGFLLYLLIRYTDAWKIRIRFFFAGAVLIIFLGLSRIILDVHYLSDVLAGYLVGTLWLIIAISLTEWLVATGYINFRIATTRKRRWISSSLLGIAVIYYLSYATWYQPIYAPDNTTPTIELDQPLTQYLKDKDLQYTSTLLGKQAQPLGVAFVAQNDTALFTQLSHAGWQSAHQFNLHQLWLQLLKPDSIGNTSLAPVFWHDKINDFAFVLPEKPNAQAMKNTLRVWKTAYRIQGSPVYLAVTRHYDDTFWRIFHSVNADIDASKDGLITSLQQKHLLHHSCNLTLVKPMMGDYFLSGRFFTKGKLTLIDLLPMTLNSQNFCPDKGIATP